MFHFIRHSFLGGIATSTGLIIALGALLIAGGFFALLWFGLAIYAAVAIGVLLVLLVTALTHRCLFSRIPSVVENIGTLGEKSIFEPAKEFILSNLWNPDCYLLIKILSSIVAVLLVITCALLSYAVVVMCALLALCLVTLIAVFLALLLSPLLMMFLASPVSLYFVVGSLLLLCAFSLITVILPLVSALLSCFGYDNKSDSMLRIADPVCRLAVWGVCTMLALFPTGFFVVYLLPSLVSTLTFTLPFWATYVGLALLFGVVLCGVLLYCRQAVLNFRLSLCCVDWFDLVVVPIDSIKVLLAQGAQCQLYRDLDSSLAVVAYFLSTRGSLFSLDQCKFLFVLLTKSGLRKADLMRVPYYQGYCIQGLINGAGEASLEVYRAALLKLLFECGKKHPKFYRHIKNALLQHWVPNFMLKHCISPFIFIPENDFWFAGVQGLGPRAAETVLSCYEGACSRVFYQKDDGTWFICYYENADYQHSPIELEEDIQALKKYAPNLVSASSEERRLAHVAFQRITDSIIAPSVSIPLYDWTQAAKDVLYYAFKSGLLSPENLEYLLTQCSSPSHECWSILSRNEGKKAVLKDLIASFEVDRADLLRVLQETSALPTTIAELIVVYCQSYANPDKHANPEVTRQPFVAST